MIIERDERHKTYDFSEYKNHISKVQKEMKKMNLDVLILTTPENLHYTTGYRSWYLSSLFRPVFSIVPQTGEPAIVLRILEKSTVKLTSWIDHDNIYVTGTEGRNLGKLDAKNHTQAVLKAINDLMPDCENVGIEKSLGGQFFWALETLEDLQKEASQFNYVDGSKAIQKARMIKSEWEIDQIRTASLITEKAVLETFAKVIPGKTTEKDVARSIASKMTLNGIDEISYLTVTSGIQKYSTPNAYATDRIMKYGEILLVDISGHYNGYASDITRMMYLDNEIPDDILDMATVSSDSVKAGKAIMKPGVTVKDLSKAVEDYIKNSKYADYLIHSSGHSMGLNVVEYPTINHDSSAILEPGMVFAVENGVYPHNKEDGAENMHLAFRMEDGVLVTETGAKWITGPAKPIYSLKDFGQLNLE